MFALKLLLLATMTLRRQLTIVLKARRKAGVMMTVTQVI
jgi:hypothetical protein